MTLIKLGLTMKNRTFVCQDALTCTSMVAQGVGEALQPYVPELIGKHRSLLYT